MLDCLKGGDSNSRFNFVEIDNTVFAYMYLFVISNQHNMSMGTGSDNRICSKLFTLFYAFPSGAPSLLTSTLPILKSTRKMEVSAASTPGSRKTAITIMSKLTFILFMPVFYYSHFFKGHKSVCNGFINKWQNFLYHLFCVNNFYYKGKVL